MTIAQLLAWSQALPTLINAGIVVETQVATLLKSFHQGMTDADINAVAALLIAGARSHLALAQADAGVKA